MSRSERHLGVGATLSLIAQVAPMVAGGVLSIVLARTLGPSGNGAYALMATVVGMVVLVAGLGLNAGITYFVSRRVWRVADALRTSLRAAAVLGSVAAVLFLVVFAATGGNIIDGLPTTLAVLGAVATPFFLAASFVTAIALGRDRVEIYLVEETAQAAVILVLGAGLAIAFGTEGAAIGFVASAVVATTIGSWLLHRAVADGIDDDVHAGGEAALRPALGFGLKAWVSNVLQQLNYRFDLIILAAYASTRDVGIYSVALTVSGIGLILPSALQMVVFPRTATLDAAASRGELTAETAATSSARAVRHTVLLLIPTAIAVAFLLVVVVPLLWGSSFDDSVKLGLILLPGVLVIGVGKILLAVITGRGRIEYALYLVLITVPVTLALYFVLIPRYGATGAAVASSSSYALTGLVCLLFFRRVVSIPLRDALLPRVPDLRDYRDAFSILWARVPPARRR